MWNTIPVYLEKKHFYCKWALSYRLLIREVALLLEYMYLLLTYLNKSQFKLPRINEAIL